MCMFANMLKLCMSCQGWLVYHGVVVLIFALVKPGYKQQIRGRVVVLSSVLVAPDNSHKIWNPLETAQ